PLHGGYGADNAVALDLFLDLVLSAQSRRINEDVIPLVIADLRVDRVPGRSRYIGYDHPVLPYQLVDDRGFPHIGLADDGHPWTVVILLLTAAVGEILYHLLQHIPQP